MPILSKDKSKFIEPSEIIKEYGRIVSCSNMYYKIGDITLSKVAIYVQCDSCGKLSKKDHLFLYKQLEEQNNKVYCRECLVFKSKEDRYGDRNYCNPNKIKETKIKNNSWEGHKEKLAHTKLERYGSENYYNLEKSMQTKLEKYGDPFYRDMEKTKQTTLDRYGMFGGSFVKGKKRKTTFSDSHKLKISIGAKKRLINKENHPMFGKKQSKESIEKNRLSNQKTTCERFNSGNFEPIKQFKGGSFFSNKMNCKIIYRSSYEKNFYTFLELCKDIESYEVEKLRIPYFDETTNKNRFYIPDVLVKWADGLTDLIEIKPDHFKDNIKNICKNNSARLFVETSEYINNFLILNREESFKYIFGKIEHPDSFPYTFLKAINDFTSGLQAEDFK